VAACVQALAEGAPAFRRAGRAHLLAGIAGFSPRPERGFADEVAGGLWAGPRWAALGGSCAGFVYATATSCDDRAPTAAGGSGSIGAAGRRQSNGIHRRTGRHTRSQATPYAASARHSANAIERRCL
jgi:hypothetical protein